MGCGIMKHPDILYVNGNEKRICLHEQWFHFEVPGK